MILITRIEYREVEARGGAHEIRRLSEHVGEEMAREIVRGRRFCRPDGTEVLIVLSEQAADVLGLQYEAWRELEQRAEAHYRRACTLDWELRKIKKAGFWTRLKWVLTGVQTND